MEFCNVNSVYANCLLMSHGGSIVKQISSQSIHTMGRIVEIKVPDILKTCFYRVLLGRAKDSEDKTIGFIFMVKDRYHSPIDFDLLYNIATARTILMTFRSTQSNLSEKMEELTSDDLHRFVTRLEKLRNQVHEFYGITLPQSYEITANKDGSDDW
jgi:hypothetical protein